MVDNTIALGIRPPAMDLATPLATATRYRQSQMQEQQFQQEAAQQKFGQAAADVLSAPANQQPTLWAQKADELRDAGLISPQMHSQWRDNYSPLAAQQLLARSMPAKDWLSQRRADEESKRAQSNADRSFGLQVRTADRLEAAANRKDVPSGFEHAPEGGLRPIKGGPHDPAHLRLSGDRQNAPAGYLWNDPSDPSKGMKAIPGGPGEKVDAEVAGRLGLAKNFLSQLPEIKADVERGDATGGFDAAKAWAGVGKPGAIRRKIDSGAEALLRMLTGAGMNKDEAAEYTRRYRVSPTDSSTTLLDKLTQLEGELNSVGETVGRGRGGWDAIRTTGPTGPTRELQVDADGWATIDGVKIRAKK